MIPQSYIEELVQRNDMVDVAQSYVQLRRRGRTYTRLCPFHSEKTPSFVVVLVRGAGQWRRNNAAPVLTVEAEVVAKRTQVSRGARAHGDMTDMTGGFTRYYATFEVESGSRIELAVRGEEYGMLAEGDRGRLTFQGTRYQGFERA